ncbi:ribose-5-phosphate isomerase RpiA [Desulforhabdus sp. TSK]|uniref:ribose-5-phosphate isomerase RpiA n=1 Tax=Desulforhabdus sp. TSK TaxID=2925014 RepID=UPI001FC88ADF|nr:ribose-5-phosphate isomerase RpiA [Desulforhabdus sp. TSK]GKT07695.1 ribose-5-phosphate isomerase A [Desulforhabdus sp. TSK]
MHKDSNQELKRKAAIKAVECIESGMVVGIGHGSTAMEALHCLASHLKDGRLQSIVAVPCSTLMIQESQRLDIPLSTLDEHPVVDLTIDGADEVDPQLNLIKGGGGAFLQEKILAEASRREIIIVDETKLSPTLGMRWAVPVEVIDFGWRSQADYLESLSARVRLRRDASGSPIRTDQNNLILDCNFGPITDPAALAVRIKGRAGIVEHGLFLSLASEVIVGCSNGVRRLTR